MALQIKDASGEVHEVPTKGMTGAALGLGIAGTALGLLGGGLTGGNGILGGNGVVTEREAVVGIQKYYEDRIADIEKMTTEFTNVREAICNLRERVSVNETANAYQNQIVKIGFGNVDTRFSTERKITDYEIAAAVCRKIDGDLFLSPAKLGNGYIAPTHVLESHEARPYCEGFGHYGYGCNPCFGGF